MSGPPARWITLVGLALLIGLLTPRIFAFQTTAARVALVLLALTPLLLLAALAIARVPRWGSWAAIWMIPYFAVGMGEMLIHPLSPTSLAWPALAVTVFFAGLHGSRTLVLPRSGAPRRIPD